ncbi:putative DNA primase protein [Corchorus olitorius]|uniref:DNA primase protein n=1 Tax=Corchorus olitorius TaxID=93759 RepID=A0A1R3JHE6_9ROSI|nr:putative DNA primase protein [Corchorus olitorius]
MDPTKHTDSISFFLTNGPISRSVGSRVQGQSVTPAACLAFFLLRYK